MNNTELKQVVQKIKECNNSDSQIEFYINELISDIVTPILTAANVSSVDEVVALLERKRDSQGFLTNTDIDDTMECTNTFLQSTLVNAMKFGNETMEHLFVSLGERLGKFKPLSDEEIELAAKDYVVDNIFDSSHISDAKSFIAGANFANRQQAGWIDVKDVDNHLISMKKSWLIPTSKDEEVKMNEAEIYNEAILDVRKYLLNVNHPPPTPKQ